MKSYRQILTIILVFFVCGCAGASRLLLYQSHPPILPKISPTNWEASFSKSKVRWDKVQETFIEGAEDITKLLFIDAQVGWATDEKVLFKTADGGQTWRKLPVTITNDPYSYMQDFFFVNKSHGWLMVVRCGAKWSGFHDPCESHIMATKDGGETWATQAEYKDWVDLRSLRFFNEHEGWATGHQLTVEKEPKSQVIMLHTMNGGNTWTNESDSPAFSNINEKGIKLQDCGLLLGGTSSSNMALLSCGRRILTKTTEAETWDVAATLQDEPNQTVYKKLELDVHNRIQLFGFAESREGVWSSIVTQKDNARWERNTLLGTDFRDAVFLTKSNLIACGARPLDNQAPHVSNGIIAFSQDSGRTWEIVYRSKETNKFFSLAFIDPQHIYAGGGNGYFVHLQQKF